MLRPGQSVALCVLALLMMGVVMVNSAGMQVDTRHALTLNTILMSRPMVYAALAMLALACCAMLPVRRLIPASVRDGGPEPIEMPARMPTAFSPDWLAQLTREYVRMWPLWLGVIGLIVVIGLVYVPGIERPRNGSHRWISLRLPGLESIQPSEIAKWGLIVLVAWFGARYAKRMHSFWLGLAPALCAAGAVAAFVVREDLGTGALLAASAAVIMLAAGARLWQMLILLPLPLAGAAYAIVSNPYRMHRIESFMNPYLDPEGKGFHMIQSMVAVANGEIFGRGLGGGLQKFEYLPEDTTDFIFAIICEELGIAGAALVLALFAGLLYGLWTITRREQNQMLKLMGLGVMATIGIQAIINLAVVTGLGPTKGIALPLLSSGGTGWILTAAAVGLIIAMDRAQALEGVMPRQVAVLPEPELETTPVVAALAEVKPVITEAAAEFVPAATSHVEMPAAIDVQATVQADPEAVAQPEIMIADAPVAPMATTPVEHLIAGAPGETGMLFALDEPAPIAASAATPAPEIHVLATELPPPIISNVTDPAAFQTQVEVVTDLPTTPVAPPEVIITDEGRDWPRAGAQLGLA